MLIRFLLCYCTELVPYHSASVWEIIFHRRILSVGSLECCIPESCAEVGDEMDARVARRNCAWAHRTRAQQDAGFAHAAEDAEIK